MISATYLSPTQFSVAGDRTAEFAPGVRVRADCGSDGFRLATVAGSTYAEPATTVTLAGELLTSGLAGVAHGNDTPESLCNHAGQHASGGRDALTPAAIGAAGEGHLHDHGGLDGLGDDDHPQYVHTAHTSVINANLYINAGNKLYFGANKEFEITHNGSNAYLISTVGSLVLSAIPGSSAFIATASGVAMMCYQNNTKIETKSTGVKVYGEVDATTVKGANVTSGSNPGHTHTAYEPVNANIQAHIASTAPHAGHALTGHGHAGVYEPADPDIQAHLASSDNPHGVTCGQIGAAQAVHSHPNATTSTAGFAILATDAIAQSMAGDAVVTAGNLGAIATTTPTAGKIPIADDFGGLAGWVPPASTGSPGLVALASAAQVLAGTDTSSAVTPNALRSGLIGSAANQVSTNAMLGSGAFQDLEFIDASFTYDPPSLANGAVATKSSISVPGAEFGDFVSVSAPYALQGVIATGYVSAADTCEMKLYNITGATVDLASGTWNVRLMKRIPMGEE